MRRPVAPCACVLALITGAWFGQAYSFFASSEPVQTEDTAAGAAVHSWRFYDAIDILLRTADESALLASSPRTSSTTSTSPAPCRVGTAWCATSPPCAKPIPRSASFPKMLLPQGDSVFARLASTGAAGGAILGIPIAGKEPWPRVDMMRVHDGRIVERWGDPTGYAPATRLFAETLTFAHHGDLIPMLRRVTIAPGASDASFTQVGPVIISVESGELDVTDAGRATSTVAPVLASLEAKILTASDWFPIADGMAFTLANRTASPATFLLLSLVSPGPAGVPVNADSVGSGNEAIAIQVLAGGTAVAANHGLLSLNLARVSLAPGARLGLHPVASLEIVAVETGTVTATIVGNPVSAWLRDPSGRSVSANGSEQTAAGYSLAISKGVTTSYANETAQPATLLLLTLSH